MKLTFPRTELLQTLKLMHTILDRGTKLPILKHVLVQTELTHLTLSATDLELGLHRTLAITCAEQGSFLIPAETVLEFVRELNEPNMQWTVEKNTLTISAAKTKAKFNIRDAQEFPALPAAPEPLLFSLPTPDFDAVLQETLPAVGEQDARYILNAIRLTLTQGQAPTLEAVGTDGKRLVMTSRATGVWLTPDHADKVMLIPKKVGKVLKSMFSNCEDTQIAIGVTQNLAAFKIGPMLLTSRLMEGQYPNYKAVVPAKKTLLFSLSKLHLEDPLRRVSVINGRDANPIHMNVRSHEIVLKAVNVDMGEATETIETGSPSRELTIGFNTTYLLDALESMPGENCQVYMDSPLAPCVLTTPERQEWTHLVMPIKI